MGPGAIYPLSAILTRLYAELRKEKLLMFNVGNISGGTHVERVKPNHKFEAMVRGKLNAIPQTAQVFGDLRAMRQDQLEKIKARMRKIMEAEALKINRDYLPDARVKAEMTFADSNPPMPPQPGNLRSFAASKVAAVLDGLGPAGFDYHTNEETTDVRSLEIATKRAAILLHRLQAKP